MNNTKNNNKLYRVSITLIHLVIELQQFLLCPEDGDRNMLRNVGNKIPINRAS